MILVRYKKQALNHWKLLLYSEFKKERNVSQIISSTTTSLYTLLSHVWFPNDDASINTDCTLCGFLYLTKHTGRQITREIARINIAEDMYLCEIRCSAFGIATGYMLDDRTVGVGVPVGSRIFTSPYRLYLFWDLPSFLSIGYWGHFRGVGGRVVGAWTCPLTSN
jgi:hypothetical protein